MAAGMALSAPGTRTACSPPKNLIKTDCSTASAASGMKRDDCLANIGWFMARASSGPGTTTANSKWKSPPLRGEFCGRNRIWLRDGTLLSGTILSPRTWPSAPTNIARRRQRTNRCRGFAASRRSCRQKPRHSKSTFTASLWLRSWRNTINVEARKWLAKKTGDQTARSLGRFKRESDAREICRGALPGRSGRSDRAGHLSQQSRRPVRRLSARATAQELRRSGKPFAKSARNCGSANSARFSRTRTSARRHLYLSLA